MKILKNILLIIINPLRTFGLGKTSDRVVKVANKFPFLIYLLSLIITAGIIVIYYFI